jgi:hypothetical protein
MCVIVLLAYGCPIQAIVKAFLLDERTVRDWQKRAGQHCQQVHEHLVASEPRFFTSLSPRHALLAALPGILPVCISLFLFKPVKFFVGVPFLLETLPR